MEKIIYHYHPVTGEFLGESKAEACSLKKGDWLIPLNATEIPVPPTKAHEAAVFGAGVWKIVPDWRGINLYSVLDGRVVTITQLGMAPADIEATDNPRPSAAHVWTSGKWVESAAKKAEILADQKVARWEKIKLERDHRTEHSGFLVGGKWYHSDAKSKLQHLGNKDSARDQLAAGGTMAAALLDPLTGFPIKWKTMDGSWQLLTVQLAFEIVAAGKASELAHHAAAEQHRAAMEAAADPAAYDFSGGWPSSYQPAPTK